MRKVARGVHWIIHDARMIIKAPKVSIVSKIELLLVLYSLPCPQDRS